MKRGVGSWVLVGLLLIVLLLVGLRVVAPYILKNEINDLLAQHEDYNGRVESVSISLISGAVTLKDLNLSLLAHDHEYPFFHVEEVDISVLWGPLFRGEVVSEVYIREPTVQVFPQLFRVWPEADPEAVGVPLDELLRGFPPFHITHFEIEKAEIVFTLEAEEEEASGRIHELVIVLTDLSNTELEEALPSELSVHGSVLDQGNLNIEGRINILKELPHFNVNMELNGLQLESLNPFLTMYGPVDFEDGGLSVYAEVAYLGEDLKGYLQPVIEDIEILDWEEERPGIAEFFAEGVAAPAARLLENPDKDRIATRIPLAGTADDPELNGLSAFWALLRNAFIEAIPDRLMHRLEIKS